MKTTKAEQKRRQAEQIHKHGLDLTRIFLLDLTSPMSLCRAVHRIELTAHRLTTDICNGTNMTEREEEEAISKILDRLDRVLNFRALGVPVFVNLDARGYALKIESEYVRDNNIEIYRDWGGYGIIAPEFDGR